MVNVYEAIIKDTGEQIYIENPAPLDSARSFVALSDAIYAQKPRRPKDTAYRIRSVMSGSEARGLFMSVLDTIDPRLAITGPKRLLRQEPVYAYVATEKWDKFESSRDTMHDGARVTAKFVGEHRDYHRWLAVGFSYGHEKPENIVYQMERYEPYQDCPIALDVTLEPGDNSVGPDNIKALRACQLTPEQELRVLESMRTIGGIVLPAAEI